jgi:hypothetical protein
MILNSEGLLVDCRMDSGSTLNEVARQALREVFETIAKRAFDPRQQNDAMSEAAKGIEAWLRETLHHRWKKNGEIASGPSVPYVAEAEWERGSWDSCTCAIHTPPTVPYHGQPVGKSQLERGEAEAKQENPEAWDIEAWNRRTKGFRDGTQPLVESQPEGGLDAARQRLQGVLLDGIAQAHGLPAPAESQPEGGHKRRVVMVVEEPDDGCEPCDNETLAELIKRDLDWFGNVEIHEITVEGGNHSAKGGCPHAQETGS